jgi:uncharacterized damage-inducible protein DinB
MVRDMLPLILDLFRHQAYADNALLQAVMDHGPASEDARLRELLHHVVAVQRFFLFSCTGEPFDAPREMAPPDTLPRVAATYQDTQARQVQWLAALTEEDLRATFQMAFFGGRSFRVWEALVQTCLHSQGHRAQCLTRLRELGGSPPTLDFILWAKDRPEPVPLG